MRRGRRNNGGLAHVGDCGSGDNKEERESKARQWKREIEREQSTTFVILIYLNLR